MARADEGYLSSQDGTRLFWRSVVPDGEPSAWVAVVHGQFDHSGRFVNTLEALAARGLGTLAFDFRGHGRSDGARGDVKVWTHYVDDLEAGWRKLRALAGERPTLMLAHSHGALVAVHWQALKPVGLKGLVMTSPYFAQAIQLSPFLVAAARLVNPVFPGLPMKNQLKPEQLSRDPAWQRTTAEDALYGTVATPRWFFAHKEAQARIWDLARGLTVPLLMCTAGDDPVVSTPTARSFFEQCAAADKTYREYPGFRHEVLNEVGKEQVLDEIGRWISAHS